MYGIVSTLDESHYALIEDLWHELQVECGLAGVFLTPLPHFSWHIAAEYDLKPLEITLDELAATTAPFTVRTQGLGLFTGSSPVIYIPLAKDEMLSRFHHCIWSRASGLAVSPSPHYAPDMWVPHITLAHGDVDPAKLKCAVAKLAFRSFNWEIEIDHLALVYQISGQVGRMQSKHPFGKIT